MALRNADTTYQTYRSEATGNHLRVLLIVCGLAAMAMAPFFFFSGRLRMIAGALFFGLVGAAFCGVQSLMRGRSEPSQNVLVTLTPVVFGAICGLAGFAIYEYMAFLTFRSSEQQTSATMVIAFLFGCLGQRLLARIAGARKKRRSRA